MLLCIHHPTTTIIIIIIIILSNNNNKKKKNFQEVSRLNKSNPGLNQPSESIQDVSSVRLMMYHLPYWTIYDVRYNCLHFFLRQVDGMMWHVPRWGRKYREESKTFSVDDSQKSSKTFSADASQKSPTRESILIVNAAEDELWFNGRWSMIQNTTQ